MQAALDKRWVTAAFYAVIGCFVASVLFVIPQVNRLISPAASPHIATILIVIPILTILVLFVVICTGKGRFFFPMPFMKPDNGLALVLFAFVTNEGFASILMARAFPWMRYVGKNLFFPALAVLTMFLLSYWQRRPSRTMTENQL